MIADEDVHEGLRSPPLSQSDPATDGMPDENSFQLFRPEAISAARERLGRPARLSGLSGGTLTAFLVALFASAGVVLTTTRYARRETVSGMLQPTAGGARIVAPRAGVVTHVLVGDDQNVRAGQPLMTLDTDPISTKGDRLGQQLLSAAGEQRVAVGDQIRAGAASVAATRQQLLERRNSLTIGIRRTEIEVGLLRERIVLAEETASTSRYLNERQYLSTITLRQREDAVIAARQALLQMEGKISELRSQIAEVEAQRRKLVTDAARDDAALRVQLGQLREREATIGAETSMNLVARQSGRMAMLHIQPGAPVEAGSVLATILPQGAVLQAELWVPSRAIGFIAPGNEVRLMFDAFPYQRFGVGVGAVTQVDQAPTDPRDLRLPIRAEEALYRVVVRLKQQTVVGYGRNWTLRPGMRLSADVVLEDASLIDWLFDQVRAATGRSSAPT